MHKKEILKKLENLGIADPEGRYESITLAIFNHDKFLTLPNVAITYGTPENIVNSIYDKEKNNPPIVNTAGEEENKSLDSLHKYLGSFHIEDLKGINLKRFIREHKSEIEKVIKRELPTFTTEFLHDNAKKIRTEVMYAITEKSLFPKEKKEIKSSLFDEKEENPIETSGFSRKAV